MTRITKVVLRSCFYVATSLSARCLCSCQPLLKSKTDQIFLICVRFENSWMFDLGFKKVVERPHKGLVHPTCTMANPISQDGLFGVNFSSSSSTSVPCCLCICSFDELAVRSMASTEFLRLFSRFIGSHRLLNNCCCWVASRKRLGRLALRGSLPSSNGLLFCHHHNHYLDNQ